MFFPIPVIAVLTLTITLLYSLAGQLAGLKNYYITTIDHFDFIRLSSSIKSRFKETQAYPADLATLTGSPGYEHLRNLNENDRFGYRSSSSLNDGVWRFKRAILAVQGTNFTSWTDYFDAANNDCGVAEITAVEWCGSSGKWAALTDKEIATREIYSQRLKLRGLLHRLIRQYGVDDQFPDDTGSMVVGDSNTFLSLIGGGVTATACSGNFVWEGIPLVCGDLFSNWSTPVSYIYNGPKSISLIARTSYTASDGDPVLIAEHMTL